MQKFFAPAFLLLSAFVTTENASADTRLGDGCDLSVLGAKDKDSFLHFDGALRSALAKQDAAALALLVEFPLTLNYGDGAHVSLNDAATLQIRFAEAFPPALRSAVLAQKSEALFCKYDGLMYGNGELWANLVGEGKAPQFRITAVNLPDVTARSPKPAETKVQLACSTDKFHIVIDGKDDAPRYRSWNTPHAPPDAPALELVGQGDGEGSGVCFHRIWRFRNSNVGYVLSQPGCSEGSVPDKAKAQLEVRIGNRPPLTSWCY